MPARRMLPRFRRIWRCQPKSRWRGSKAMADIAALRDRFEGRHPRHLARRHHITVPAHRALPTRSISRCRAFKAETAQIAFDLEGVSLSAGSACSSGKVGEHPMSFRPWGMPARAAPFGSPSGPRPAKTNLPDSAKR